MLELVPCPQLVERDGAETVCGQTAEVLAENILEGAGGNVILTRTRCIDARHIVDSSVNLAEAA